MCRFLQIVSIVVNKFIVVVAYVIYYVKLSDHVYLDLLNELHALHMWYMFHKYT